MDFKGKVVKEMKIVKVKDNTSFDSLYGDRPEEIIITFTDGTELKVVGEFDEYGYYEYLNIEVDGKEI